MTMKRRDLFPFAAIAMASIAAAAAMTSLTGCAPSKAEFKAVDVTGADYARDFHLSDQYGQQRSMADFKNKVVVVFFGYTQCPDVCPTSMSELAEVKKQLGADANRLQGIFVSIDPERDTPEVLKAYMANFDPSFIALRPDSPEQLAAMAKDFKVYYKKVEGKTPTSYTMDHSAGSYVYDPQGRLRLFVRYGSGPQPLIADVQALLKGA
jgi:protein SCO1/2